MGRSKLALVFESDNHSKHAIEGPSNLQSLANTAVVLCK